MITEQDVDKAWNIYWSMVLDAAENNWPDGSEEAVDLALSNYLSTVKQFAEEQHKKHKDNESAKT